VKPPAVVMRPILEIEVSVNHRFPSEPTAISCGLPAAANSVTVPDVVMRPILPMKNSVNQRFPSGPAVMPPGSEPAVVTGNSVIVWAAEKPGSARPSREQRGGGEGVPAESHGTSGSIVDCGRRLPQRSAV
jgi:hypothetical protein